MEFAFILVVVFTFVLVKMVLEQRATARRDNLRVLEEALLLVNQLDQVHHALGIEALRSDVDVDARRVVGPRARRAHRADDVLQLLDVVVAEDRRDDLAAVLAAAQRAVRHDLPGAPARGGDAHVPVVVRDGAAHHAVDGLGELRPAQAHRLDLDPESQRLHRGRPRVLRGAQCPSREDIQASVRAPSKAEHVDFACVFRHLE